MTIALLKVTLLFPQSRSLKHKRSRLKSLKDRLRASFNVSVAEVGYQDTWQRSILAIARVGQSKPLVEAAVSKILGFVEEERDLQVADYETELIV